MLIVAWDMQGIQRGLLFRTWEGGVILMSKLDSLFHWHLVQVQAEHPELIPANVCIKEEYSLHCSLQ